MSRSNKIEMYEREKEIREALSQGISLSNMVKSLASKHKCSESTIRKQYLSIMRELSEDDKGKREELRQTLIMRNDHCYRLALQEGKIKTAIDANMANAKISGILNSEEVAGAEMPKFIDTVEKDFSKPIKAVGED